MINIKWPFTTKNRDGKAGINLSIPGLVIGKVPLQTVYVRLTAKGIPFIHDGREFVLGVWNNEPLIGRLKTSGSCEITYNGETLLAKPVSDETSLICDKCGSGLKHQLLWHNGSWMSRALYCLCSPRDIWLDVFPKMDPFSCDTTHSWENGFYGFAVPDKLPEGVVITNYETPRERFLRLKKSATATYLLTPDGIQNLK